jgi:hypothetical protein
MAARSKKKQSGSGVLPWIALLLLAVVVATFVYAHVHVVSQHTTAHHPHMPPPRQRQLEEPVPPPTPSQTKRKKTINDVTNELDPMDRLLEQSRMRAERGDVCADDVFIVHWTHVPKAGGTAFAGMAKKISCARNPAIASSNPCCVRDVCVAEGSCHSTASTCPLVQGIGKHTSNMGRLALVPCCGREWYLSTVISFLCRRGVGSGLQRGVSTRWRRGDAATRRWRRGEASLARAQYASVEYGTARTPSTRREGGVDDYRPRRRYAIRPAPTDEELAKFGLAYDPHRPYHPVSNGAAIKCLLDGVAETVVHRETERGATRRWRGCGRTKSSVASMASREANGVGERDTH